MESFEVSNNFTLSEDINGPLLAAVIGVEMLAGLITNSIVIIMTVCRSSFWKHPSTIFLTNLLLSDLVIILFVMPFSITTGITGYWVFGHTLEEKIRVCYFAAYMYWYSVLLVTQSLVILSFDRFFYIIKSFLYERHMTGKKAIMVVLLSWTLASVINVTPFFGFGSFRFIISYGNCAPRWEGETWHVLYTLTIFLFYIISIIITSAWTFIYTRKFLKNEQVRKEFICKRADQRNIYITKERRLIGLFGMIMVSHLVCYAPGIIAVVAVLISPLPHAIYASIYILFLMITTLSPLIQVYFRRDLRETVLRVFKCQPVQRGRQDSSSFMLTPTNV